jgi:hypothetical protein
VYLTVHTTKLQLQRVYLFFVFSSGILGETRKTKNKSAKVAIFTEFVLGDCQKQKNKAGFYEISIFPSGL